MSQEIEFGDQDPDDAFDPADENVSWDEVETLAEKVAAVEAIEDGDRRLVAAKALVAELGG